MKNPTRVWRNIHVIIPRVRSTKHEVRLCITMKRVFSLILREQVLFPINNVSYFTKFYYEGWKAAVCNPTSRMCGISEKYHTVVKNEAISHQE